MALKALRRRLKRFGYNEEFIKMCIREAKRISKVLLEGYEWVCPSCGRVFHAFYYDQVLQFIESHLSGELRKKLLEEARKKAKKK